MAFRRRWGTAPSVRPSGRSRDCCRRQNTRSHLTPREDYFRANREGLQLVEAERRRKGNVGGIAAAGDQDAADAWDVVARVEGEPAAPEVHLEPRTEIHRRGGGGSEERRVGKESRT